MPSRLPACLRMAAPKRKRAGGVTSSPVSCLKRETDYLRANFLRPMRPAASKPLPRSIIEPGSGAPVEGAE